METSVSCAARTAPSPHPTDPAEHDGWALWGALVVASIVLQAPFLLRGLSPLDEGSIVAIAEALQRGEVLYRDRATFVGPLTYEVLRVLFDMFGPSLIVGRLLEAALFTVCVLCTFALLAEMTDRAWALGGTIAFLAIKPLAFPGWTMLGYSQVAMALAMLSVLALLRGFRGRCADWLPAVGAGVGLTLITKQNVGVLLGVTVAVGVVADVWAERRSRPFAVTVLRRGAVLGIGILLPVSACAVFYGYHGALGDLTDRAILALPSIADEYAVALPTLRLWPATAEQFGSVALTYLPTVLWHLVWDEQWPLFASPAFRLVEVGVKAAYFVPLVALVVSLRVLIGAEAHRRKTGLLVLTTFAATAYASMLYRADWAHLMNVYPPLLLLCVVVLHWFAARRVASRWMARTLLLLWCAWGVVTAVLVVHVYRHPVDTPRGGLWAPARTAEDARQVLAYLDRVPRAERIVFLRAEPLYYFLSGRDIPITHDLVMPGYVRPGDDTRLAEQLSAVDAVVFNPSRSLNVSAPLTGYAPQSAAALSSGFEMTEIVGPSAIAFRRRLDSGRSETVVTRFWEQFDRLRLEGSAGGRVTLLSDDRRLWIQPTTWMAYHVITATMEGDGVAPCFSVGHDVQPGDVIAATPMFRPDFAARTRRSTGDARRDAFLTPKATFTILIPGVSDVLLYEEQRSAAAPARETRIPLSRFVDQRIVLRFCAGTPMPTPLRQPLPTGWAEPRIIRPLSPVTSMAPPQN